MGEYILGVDFGTSKVAAVLIDPEKKQIIRSVSAVLDPYLPDPDGRKKEQRIEDVEAAFGACTKELFDDEKGCRILSIGLTGQMHGIVGLGDEGRVLTPLVTWQDERGSAPTGDGRTLLEEMQVKAGPRPIASGYGIVTLYDWMKGGALQGIRQVCSVADYFGMRLIGERLAVMDFTMAESLGAFDVVKSIWDEKYISFLEIPLEVFPSVVSPTAYIGEIKRSSSYFPSRVQLDGAPVSAALGDNQASFIGSVKDHFSTLLVNMGTGSQVSYALRSLKEVGFVRGAVDGYDVCIRPFVRGGFLVAGNALSGGATYVLLRDFFTEVGELLFDREAPPDLWERMNRLADERESAGGLRIDPHFTGKRSDPDMRGSISGISSTNFTPSCLIFAILEGMVRVLREMVGETVLERMRYLVGSGNGMRKNRILRALASRIFEKPLSVPRHEEEAAFGAALNGGVAAGIYRNFEEAGSIIHY